MANPFEKKEWVDRQSETPSRRKLVATDIENVYEIERYEGEVTEVGDAYNADNMNDVEDRVYSGFENLDDTGIKITDPNNKFTSSYLVDCLYELFQYAASGKKAIASAIGSNASSSNAFSTLAGLITSGKQSLVSAIGSGSTSSTFSTLASLITSLKSSYQSTINSLNSKITSLNSTVSSLKSTITSLNSTISSGKGAIASAIGATSNGTPSSTADFDTLSGYISNYKKSFYVGRYQLSKSSIGSGNTKSISISKSFGFTPSTIFIHPISIDYDDSDDNYTYQYLNGIYNGSSTYVFGDGYNVKITNVSSSGFTLQVKADSDISNFELGGTNLYIYAYS